MKKNGRTLREDTILIKRGIKEFQKMLPGQMQRVFLKSFFGAGISYISVIMSAMIIDELAQGRSREKLFFLCGISVAAVFLFSVLNCYQEAKITARYSYLFQAHEIYLTKKSYRLPYEVLERKDVGELREQISGNINLSGGGMASLYWDMEVVFKNACQTVIAIIFCGNFFVKMVSGNAGNPAVILNAAEAIFVLAVVIIICSCVSCKMAGKRFDVNFEIFHQMGAKYNRYGEFYTMNYLSDENAALDIRMFQQDKIIMEESQRKCYERFAKGKQKEIKAVNKYDGIRLVCSCICQTAVYLLVGQKALQGVIGVGSILMIYAAVTMMITSLSELSQIITDLRNNNEHLICLFQYMDLPENGEEEGEIRNQEEKCENISFVHVSFQYPESETWVLHDINLSVAAGEKLAIVGENGSGKTTLIKLLCRLYKPTKGKILINGTDIWSYSNLEYMKMISTVFQDFSLFAFSLAENVAASRSYEKELVENVLEKAGLKQKLKQLPKGMEQTLFHDYEEAGTDLSGGEAQKVAIARAVYKDGEIMILDEPTAALDPYAEYDIYRNFHNITSDKTVFSISHRLSSCRMCDKIAVMEKGKLVQYGTHDQLVKQENKIYSKMWQAQAQYYKE